MPEAEKSSPNTDVTLRFNWYHVLLAAVIAVTIFTRFHHLGDKPFHHDESLYGKYIWNFYTGLGYEYDPMQHGPFPFIVGQLTAFLFGISDTAIRFTPATLGVLTVIMVLMWAPVIGRWESLMAGAIMAISPAFMYFQRFLREDASFLFNCTGLVTAVMFYLFRGQKAKYVYWTAAFYALMFATKENHFVMAFTLASFGVLYGLRAMWTAWTTDGTATSLGRAAGAVATRYPAAAKGLKLFVIWFGAFCLYAVGEVALSKKFEQDTWTDIIRAYWILVFLGYAASVAYDIWRRRQKLEAGEDPGYYADAKLVAWAFGLFVLIFVSFYTGMFTSFVGFWRSIYGWFTYWLHQHSIQRIEGPYHYYHRLLWNYENLSMVPFLVYILSIALMRTRGFYAFVVVVICYGAAYIPGSRALLEKAQIGSWILFAAGLGVTGWAVWRARGTAGEAGDEDEAAAGGKAARTGLGIANMGPARTRLAIGLALLGFGFGFLLSGDAFHLTNRNFTSWNAVYAAGCVVLSLWAAMWLTGRGQALQGFLIYWGTFNYVIYSYLQEKVPWLVINITLPMLLLSGILLVKLLRQPQTGARGWRGITALVLLAIGVVYTVHSTVLLNWYNESDPTEQIVYVQTTRDVTDTMREIEQMGIATGLRRELPIVLQGDPTWPFYFYLRDYKKLLFSPNAADKPAVALCDWNKRHEYATALGEDNYIFRRRRLRHWWIPSREHMFTDTMAQLNLLQAKLSGQKGAVTGEFKWETLRQALKTEVRFLTRWLIHREMFRDSAIYGSTDYAYFIRKDLAAREFNQDLGPKPAEETADVKAEPLRERRVFMPVRVFGEKGPGRQGLTDPKSVAVSADGSVYVADYGNSRIQKFNAQGEHVKTIGSQGNAPGQFDKPCGVAVDAQGNLYVADTWNHRVQKLTPDGDVLAVWGGAGVFYAPKHLGVFADGSVAVVDTGFHRIHILGPDGAEQRVFGTQGSGRDQFYEPVGLWVTGADSFVVADTANHRLVFLNKAGTYLSAMPMFGWKEFYSEPYVAQDRSGRFLVSDSFNDRIMVYDGKGDILWYWGEPGEQPGKFSHPVGVTVGPDGLAYIVDSVNSRIQVFEVPA